ncbi:MAG: hypothetical protein AUG51_23590 [Acidobacteria bacterium 13_1_20CM_3_53_8]|nr:MAG: hypothetical protein AUG51_23590 [Acidobacteria bacterium 13_1_20CM_3_53_8]
MQKLIILSLGLLLSIAFTVSAQTRAQSCLPNGMKLTDIVSYRTIKPGARRQGAITVEQKLAELRARCKRGKLVDARGREIYFYRLQGCWGNPPSDYQEILQRQDQEIRRLKKRYTVIEMTCNPSGVQIP